jgi:acyl-CoA reductase-like NAD-dependent aldehyde dehydrogenase
MTQNLVEIISPIDGSIYATRPLSEAAQVETSLAKATNAQALWQATPLETRAAFVLQALDIIDQQRREIALELAWQMGRPLRYGDGEVNGFLERGRHMVAIAESALQNLYPAPQAGFERYIERRPLGVVLVIAAWNYPYLIAVNSIVPALMAGNCVVLKHSGQTLLSGERLAAAFQTAAKQLGLSPALQDGLISCLTLDHKATAQIIADPRIAHVNFTGSVSGGHAIVAAAKDRFIGLGLELGGKDPAYVRADADLGATAEALVDGSFFNSGQSCCGIERIYAEASVHDELVERMVASTQDYVLGDPLDEATTLGPMVRTQAADMVRQQISDAVAQGAKPHLEESTFAASQSGTPYLAPQILTQVTHAMEVMRAESFGPVVGIMAVENDAEAIAKMNDSVFGLTASVWTQDTQAAKAIGAKLRTGTFFMNRCDYLDPGLAWTGIGDTGRGASLSQIGYEQLTRPMSFHLKTGT